MQSILYITLKGFSNIQSTLIYINVVDRIAKQKASKRVMKLNQHKLNIITFINERFCPGQLYNILLHSFGRHCCPKQLITSVFRNISLPNKLQVWSLPQVYRAFFKEMGVNNYQHEVSRCSLKRWRKKDFQDIRLDSFYNPDSKKIHVKHE